MNYDNIKQIVLISIISYDKIKLLITFIIILIMIVTNILRLLIFCHIIAEEGFIFIG